MATQAEKLESNIVATVATAEAVLTHFERSLIDSGFAEGASAYVRLAETLVGQRLWAETSGMAHKARFAAVAARAQSIHALLVPYVAAFQQLGALGIPALLDDEGSHEADPPTRLDDDDPVSLGVLDAIDRAGRPLSSTALRASLGVSKMELTIALDRLVAAGRIERRQSSGRELIRRIGE